ncbi:MAG: YbjN domain-containing protein [Acidobacteriota bacterium]|nr:YbjN domain-containing protein [Acidobacteriota bacterium]
MKKPFSIFISFSLLTLLAVSALAQEKPKIDKASASKIVQMLEDSGHTYGKSADNVWVVRFRGETLDDIRVITSGHESMLFMLVVVAEKKDFKVTPELMMKLLRLNDDYDRLKVAIDDDGDMLVRIDLSLRVTDSQEFKLNVEQISAAADEIATAIKPFMVAGPTKKPVK